MQISDGANRWVSKPAFKTCDRDSPTLFCHSMGAGGADIGLSFLLPRLCGYAAASELMLTHRWMNADRCLAVGLVSDIVAPEKLIEEGRQLARDMLEMSHMVGFNAF